MRRTLRALALVVPLAACSSQAEPQPAAIASTDSVPAAPDATAPATTTASATTAPATTSASTAASATTAPATTVGEVDVPAALAFGATLVGGGPIDLAEYAGKPVAFWFWAPT